MHEEQGALTTVVRTFKFLALPLGTATADFVDKKIQSGSYHVLLYDFFQSFGLALINFLILTLKKLLGKLLLLNITSIAQYFNFSGVTAVNGLLQFEF